jgi:hypothetical protein
VGNEERDRAGLEERERQDQEIAEDNQKRQARQGHIPVEGEPKEAKEVEEPKTEVK